MIEEQKYVKTSDGVIIVFQAPIFHSKMRHIADIVSAGFISFGGLNGIPQCRCYGRSESLNLDSEIIDTEIANKQLFGLYFPKEKDDQ
jgi:hypothetical protein